MVIAVEKVGLEFFLREVLLWEKRSEVLVYVCVWVYCILLRRHFFIEKENGYVCERKIVCVCECFWEKECVSLCEYVSVRVFLRGRVCECVCVCVCASVFERKSVWVCVIERQKDMYSPIWISTLGSQRIKKIDMLIKWRQCTKKLIIKLKFPRFCKKRKFSLPHF
jgi:hypothetical protein